MPLFSTLSFHSETVEDNGDI